MAHQNILFLRIQVLRLIAAAAVVLYHTQVTTGTYFGGTNPYPILEYASHGVDLFFVISGFIIVFIGSTRETTAPLFVKRRIERIVPLYWMMTLAMFALTHIPGIARKEASGPLHLIQSVLFFSWTNGPATYPVLNVGWTLEFEVLFYAVAAIAMALSKRVWATTALVMLAMVVTGQGTSFFLQNPIMIEFVFGMTIGTFLYDRRTFPWMLAGTALVLVTLPMTVATQQVWIFGLPSALIVAVAVYADVRKSYRGTVLPELGNASYSIYLAHVIAISFACKILVKVVPSASRAIIIPLIAVFALVIGYAVYQLIEKRLIAFAHKRRSRALDTVPEVAPPAPVAHRGIFGDEQVAPAGIVTPIPQSAPVDQLSVRRKTKAL